MKKITLLLITLVTINSAHSQITYNDIADFTFTPNSFTGIGIDFNNDTIPEFTLDEQGDGTVGTFFNSTDFNFIGYGSLAGGYGWDIIKPLTNGFTVNNTGSFEAQGDAYINAMWQNPGDEFPEGISYVGVKLKLGANTHYGWLRVNSASGVITLLDYAYNTTANESINAGQQVLSINDFSNTMKVSYYPNPAKDVIHINSKNTIKEANLIDISGKTIILKVFNNNVNISAFPSGVYFLHVKSGKNTAIKKIIKI
ncbi:MAG: T9SS type A sorting domain-containing protein [Flavobacteriaceae bacterium]|nr:T9SS type A sorting domain-containing protein [Flavobacteriaceae bacterium]